MLYILVYEPTINCKDTQWMAYGESRLYGAAWNVDTPTFIDLKKAKKLARKEMKSINTLGFKMIPEQRKEQR